MRHMRRSPGSGTASTLTTTSPLATPAAVAAFGSAQPASCPLPRAQPRQQVSKDLPLRVTPGATRRPQPTLHTATPMSSAHSSSTTAARAGRTSRPASSSDAAGSLPGEASSAAAAPASGSAALAGLPPASPSPSAAAGPSSSARFSSSSAFSRVSERPMSTSTSLTEAQALRHPLSRWSEAFMGESVSASTTARMCATRVQLPPKISCSASRLPDRRMPAMASRSQPRMDRRLSSAEGSFTALPCASTTLL
mmetsp:Transcript_67099/g.208351  ORF Transcript_67099/g.208351 Transcript_67099/m.208351 type:complete len:252 (+) Transcript_67099:222-977(+)